MAKPAASSLALLTRKPDDRRAMAVDRLLVVLDSERCAVRELRFVLMPDMVGPLKSEKNPALLPKKTPTNLLTLLTVAWLVPTGPRALHEPVALVFGSFNG
jgi:hypothetical protein